MFYKILTSIIYTIVISFFLFDLVIDYVQGKINVHFYVEVVCAILMFYLLIYQAYKTYTTSNKLLGATKTIQKLQGKMSNFIDEKFIEWELTPAEKDVSWLMIKGFSFKNISDIRNVSEKTVQQQSLTIYQKSNSKNRHEFISNFIEEFIHSK